MARNKKVEKVKELEEVFSNASSLVLAEYRGLSVNQQMRLRRELDNVGASFSVIKMSLAKRAAENISRPSPITTNITGHIRFWNRSVCLQENC